MASKLAHTVHYPFSVTRLWEVLSTEDYWHHLLSAINSSHASLGSFAADADTIIVEMTQGVPAEKLPSAVTKIRPGDLEIPRRSTFKLAGDIITGSLEATVSGAPAKVNGELRVAGADNPEGDTATAEYTGSVEVSVPFVGGKIEKAIIEQLEILLDTEAQETASWAAEKS